MRHFDLHQTQATESSWSLYVLRRLFSNWRKRRRLRDLQQLDERILKDIGINRFDLSEVLNRPLSVDPVRELERRSRLRRCQAMPVATRRWLRDRAFRHPGIDAHR